MVLTRALFKQFRCLTVIAGLLFAFGFQQAQAARAFFDSTFATVYGVCPVTGDAVVTTQTQVGYFVDPNEPYPKTGDVVYVRAMSTNVSPCTNDAVGFDFFFPQHTEFAIDATNRVRCYRVRISDGYTEEYTQDSNGGCSQTPSVGPFGGNYFGWSAIAPGWRVEIRVPVRFNQHLLGLAGPNTHKLQAAAQTVFGNAVAELLVTSFYEADFLNSQSTSVTSTSAALNTNLYSYFKAGQLYLDYGTSTGLGSSLPPASVPDNALNFPNISSSLTGLTPGTTYYWRYRFVTSAGTFTSPTQTFTTSGGGTSNFALNVSKSGTGSGTVTSSPSGIDCGSTCSSNFAQGTSVTLTPSAVSGSRFNSWSGACTGSGACTITMNAAATVSASFMREIGSLSMTLNGLPASTTVTVGISGPDGYNTTRTLMTGTGQTLSDVVTGAYTLTAPNVTVGTTTYIPNVPSQTVNVTFGATATINVNYAAATTPVYALTVTKGGTGAGTVSSNPVGLTCGGTCTATFTQNAVVSLTATASSGSTFDGWGGSCTGTGSCNVTMDAAKNVTATFNTASSGTFVLEVAKAGTGQGTVTSTPSGINCGPNCSASFATGSSVTLSVTPATGSSFIGWSGACTGNGSCTVTMDAAKTVTATFQISSAPIQVSAAKAIDLPISTSAATGDSSIPLLSFALVGDVKLTALTLKATGTGNDALDLSAVKLVLDTNGDGKVDAGETILAQGTFAADDGEVTLTLASPQTLSSSSPLLVTVDVNQTLAALAALPLLGLTALGFVKRKQVRALLFVLLLPLLLAAQCGGQPPTATHTYQLSLIRVSATTPSGDSLEITGLPLEGTVLTVKP